MNKNDYVDKVLSYVPSVVKGSVKMELEAHIEDRAEFLELCGYSADMAESMAAERMGSAEIIGPELSKLHSGKMQTKGIILAVFCIYSLVSAVYYDLLRLGKQYKFT